MSYKQKYEQAVRLLTMLGNVARTGQRMPKGTQYSMIDCPPVFWQSEDSIIRLRQRVRILEDYKNKL